MKEFYTLFAVKKKYHKLFTPNSQHLFYCAPSEQLSCGNVDSSVLFPKGERTYPFTFKYDFLKNTNVSDGTSGNDTVNCSLDSEDLLQDGDDISGSDSDDTIVYDISSYKNTGKNFVHNDDDTDDFHIQLTKMHRKINHDNSDALSKLMTCTLQEIIDDPALNQELKNCKEDGNWDNRIVKTAEVFCANTPFGCIK